MRPGPKFRAIAASIHYSSLQKSLMAFFSALTGASKHFDRVSEYEKTFAQAEGVAFTVATSMARVALFHILQSLNLRPGERVLLSPVNIPEMLAVLQLLQLEPVFVDFEENSLFPSLKDLEKKITLGPARVFFLTFIAGQIGDLRAFQDLCQKNKITFIQDATQANLCLFAEKSLPSWADYTFYSTCELKFVHTYRGAMICTNSPELHDKVFKNVHSVISHQKLFHILQKWLLDSCLALALNPFFFQKFFRYFKKWIFTQNPLENFELKPDFFKLSSLFGSDYHKMQTEIPARMFFKASNFEAQAGLSSLKKMSELIKKHQSIATTYAASLQNSGLLPNQHPLAQSSYWRFPLLFPNVAAAENFRQIADTSGVVAERSGLSLLSHDVKQARAILERCVFIPCHAGLNSDDVEAVIDLCLNQSKNSRAS
ncbi:MAG: DegT/DnrJ/EryC1/StrS family aminotransferase [Bdellovibrionota bacterium]